MGHNPEAIFGCPRNVLVCYELDASQAGAVPRLLQSDLWVFPAALLSLQWLPPCCDSPARVRVGQVVIVPYEAVPIVPPFVASCHCILGLLGYFTCVCDAGMKGWELIKFSGAQEAIQNYRGLTQETGSEMNQGIIIVIAVIITLSPHWWRDCYMSSTGLVFVWIGDLKVRWLQGPHCQRDWMKPARWCGLVRTRPIWMGPLLPTQLWENTWTMWLDLFDISRGIWNLRFSLTAPFKNYWQLHF